MKNFFTITVLFLGIVCSLSGCKQSADELVSYKNNMTLFTTSINRIHNEMNALDVNSPESTELALQYLDELDNLFRDLASMSVPEEFVSIESLANEASEYMTIAVTNYHIVFTSTPYNSSAAILAEENYSRAMKRQYYIGEILQGKVPEGDDIIVLTEDDTEVLETPSEEIEYIIPSHEDSSIEDLLEP